MKNHGILASLLLGLTCLEGQAAASPANSTSSDFILGVQASGSDTALRLPELGVRWTRFSIGLNAVIPEIPDPDLTLEEVMTHPDMVDQLLLEGNWTSLDAWVTQLSSAGLNLFPVVGLGWEGTYAMIDGVHATPDVLGADTYLAYMYLYTRAVVERYDGDGNQDAPGIRIKYWQIENELNQALLTAIWGWREPVWLEGFSSLWADWEFLTDLLDTLGMAVHDSDPYALTTQNFHTDIPPEYNRILGTPGWPEAIVLWRHLVDLVGFDAYPNYYYAQPVNGSVVGDRARTIIQLANGQPVIAMEVGYPSGPLELGYTEEAQAQFLEEAFHSAVDAGVVGYFYFTLKTTETHTVVITEEDLAISSTIGHLFDDGRTIVLLAWASQNLDYVEDHFFDVLKAVEGYWGLITPEGRHKPSWEVMEDLVLEVNASQKTRALSTAHQASAVRPKQTTGTRP